MRAACVSGFREGESLGSDSPQVVYNQTQEVTTGRMNAGAAQPISTITVRNVTAKPQGDARCLLRFFCATDASKQPARQEPQKAPTLQQASDRLTTRS